MEEAFWAARQGDALLHTSFMADVLGAVLEVAANVVIDALIVGTTSLLATSVGITMGCTAVVLTGFVAGVAMVYSADENCMTFVSGMGRRLDMEAVLPGSG
ncbi:TPA: hypothetical protein ACGSCU_002861, partial [Escherichia coli]